VSEILPELICFFPVCSGLGKVTLTDIEAGLSQCTHLVYGWTGINDAKKAVSLNSQQDLDQGKGLKASLITLGLVLKDFDSNSSN
jgi:hypothetical protein